MTFVCRKKIKNSIHVQHTQYEQNASRENICSNPGDSNINLVIWRPHFLTNVLYIAEDIANGTVMIVRECRSH